MIGAQLFMGIERLPQLSRYWHHQYSHPFIRNLFTRDRFKLLLSVFCACDPVDDAAVSDPARHAKELVEYLTQLFPRYYHAAENLCIDESIVAFKGHSDQATSLRL